MRPSLLARALLALVRGEESEFLRGDLEEWWAEEQVRRAGGARRRSYEIEIAHALVAWWRPRSVLARLGDRPRRLGDLPAEVRIVLRTLVRHSRYALLVIGVLGTGIGATTTVLTVVDRVLIRSLPFPESDRLAVIGNTFPDREWRTDQPDLQHLAGFSLANFVEWEQRTRTFERVVALEQMGILLPDDGSGPEVVQSRAVTRGFFDLLDVQPQLGRLFHPDEFTTAAGPVVVLSHEAWVTRYGADPSVVGGSLNSVQGGARIVGVLPPDFALPEAIAQDVSPFWFPIAYDSDRYADRGRRGLTGIGLLQEGTALEAARQELSALGEALAREYPEGNVYPDGRRLGIGANPLQAHTVGAMRRPISLFMAAALVLMLISGLNAANLMLVRSMARRDEIAVRLALGSGRRGVMRLFVIEALVLAGLAALVGVGLAAAGLAAFRTLGPESVPRMAEVGLDLRVLTWVAAMTLGTGVVMGAIPALRHGRTGSHVGTGAGGRTTSRQRAWPWTVAAQVALSMVLMMSAGLLMESFLRLRAFDPGFDTGSALTFTQGMKRPGTGALPTHYLWDEVLDQVAAVAGYTDVAAASNLPFESPNWAPWVLLPGDAPDTHRTGIAGYVVTHDFFRTLDIPVLAGRGFDASDGPDSRPVVTVNQAFADAYFRGADPVGSVVRFRTGEDLEELGVIGVVGNAVQTRPEDGMRPAVYRSYRQTEWPSATVFARATGDPLQGVADIRRRISEVNPYVPPLRISTMEDRIAGTRVTPRFNASLAMAFGLVSLLLSASGLYASLSFGVARRLKEIGVRLALGATRGSVLKLVLAQGLRVTVIGLLVGLLSALLMGSALAGFLFDVRPTSPVAIGVVTLSLLLVAAVASLGPALRATRVDPVRSLTRP